MTFIAPAAAALGNVAQNPNTWQAVSAVGGAVQAFGSHTAGKQQQAAYNLNADLSTMQAAATGNAAALNEFKKNKLLLSVIGSQQAAYGARGVDTISGSPIDVMTNDLANGKLDIAIDNYNYDVAKKQYEHQAVVSRYYGETAKSSGDMAAGTSLLKTAADFGMAYSKTKIGEGKK